MPALANHHGCAKSISRISSFEALSNGTIDFLYSLPDTFSTLRHMINSLNQMAFIFFPAEHDVKVGSLYTPP